MPRQSSWISQRLEEDGVAQRKDRTGSTRMWQLELSLY
jgi:hypothetical protein